MMSVYTEVMRQPLPLRRFAIRDTSMQPALQPGDRVLVLQWGRPAVGDLVVFREPDAHLTFAVKRVGSITAKGDVEVFGDNPNASRDSRHYGPVPRHLLVGRVVYRYLPGARRGRLTVLTR